MTDLPTICNIEEVEFVYFHDLPESVQPDFDWDTNQDETYFEYRGNWYALGEFMRNEHTHRGVDEAGEPVEFESDGAAGRSYFHAVLIKINHSCDGATVASHFC